MSIGSLKPGLVCFTLATCLSATVAPAQMPAGVRKLLDCRSITDGGARLRCFDANAASLDEAIERRDVVVVDQPEIQKARRSLFGLTLPNLDGLLGRAKVESTGRGRPGDKGPPPVDDDQIEARIAAATRDPYHHWTIVLDDGARWIQTDGRDLPLDPAKGQPIRIRRSALGGYFAKIDGQVAIQVRRER